MDETKTAKALHRFLSQYYLQYTESLIEIIYRIFILGEENHMHKHYTCIHIIFFEQFFFGMKIDIFLAILEQVTQHLYTKSCKKICITIYKFFFNGLAHIHRLPICVNKLNYYI